MLPDFPDIKAEMQKQLLRFLEMRARFYGGLVGEIRQHTIHEGQENSIVRPTGEEEKTDIVSLEKNMEVKWREVPQQTLQDILLMLDDAAKDIAHQKSKHFFEIIDKGVEKVGNIINGKGQPLSSESVLQLLEKIQLEFNESGQIDGLNIVIPASKKEKMQEIMNQFVTDPTLRKRHSQLMEIKKEQWRDREAARILVG